mmetsp:Transcript_1418/g.1256  ORF Transcript_1418/g.1256 Transcript_1418/m.1256 type:complete len:103 (+) Transcript_1418:35-343(+)
MQMQLLPVAARTFYYPDASHVHLQQEPHIVVKRIINVVGARLRHMDPNRWDSVPITWNTNWADEGGRYDIKTCILIHDAIEREFNFDIDDKKELLMSVQDCF